MYGDNEKYQSVPSSNWGSNITLRIIVNKYVIKACTPKNQPGVIIIYKSTCMQHKMKKRTGNCLALKSFSLNKSFVSVSRASKFPFNRGIFAFVC